MGPILAEIKRDYAGKLTVEEVNVHENPEAAEPYHIRQLPTQVFLDTHGDESFRHEGFYPKEELIAKLAELGVKK